MPRPRIPPRLILRRSSLLLLTPLALVTAQQASAAQAPPGAPPRSAPVFSDFFTRADWGSPGAVWCPYSSAYPDGRTNPDDLKLDRLRPTALSIAKGGGLQFRATAATRSPSGRWSTGLLTTEPWGDGTHGGDGFTLRPDDYVLVHLRLPNRKDGGGHGAWPGVWTWKDGDNEIDILEWHSETPDLAEFVDHVNGDSGALARSSLLGFGTWVYVAARLGTDAVTWYLGDSPHHLRAVASDPRGVPPDWRAYLVVNLSVSGQRGRTPTTRTPITARIGSLQVYRPLSTRVEPVR